jgi:hypothetical protein
MRRSPYGELRNCDLGYESRERSDVRKLTPLIPCHTAPPTACRGISSRFGLEGNKTYTHGECTAEIIENHPGTRVARMIHVVWFRLWRSGQDVDGPRYAMAVEFRCDDDALRLPLFR